jgi:hypothetical protein
MGVAVLAKLNVFFTFGHNFLFLQQILIMLLEFNLYYVYGWAKSLALNFCTRGFICNFGFGGV